MPDVSSLLASPSAEDRRQAILTLVRTRAHGAEAILERLSEGDPAPQLRYLARRALTALREGHESLLIPAGSGTTAQPGVPEAVRLLAQADAASRASGVALAVRTGEPLAAPRLLDLLTRETDEPLRAGALAYFARHGRPVHTASLIPLVRDRSAPVRARLVAALATAGGDKAWPYAVYLLQDPEPEPRKAAREYLAGRPRAQVLELLSDMVGAPELWMRDSATYALGHLEVAEAVPALARASADAAATVRAKALKGLEKLAARNVAGAADALAQAKRAPAARAPAAAEASAQAAAPAPRDSSAPGGLDDPNPRVRIASLTAAVDRADRALTAPICARLEVEENEFVLAKLLIALGHLGGADAAKVCEPYLGHPDARVVASAIEALDRLGSRAASARVRPLLAHRAPRVRANALHYFRDDANVNVEALLSKMLGARDFPSKLSALWLLSRLPRERYGTLVQAVLGDINDEVREKAFQLLDGWARTGSEDAQAMLDMCRAGDVAIKHESLRLARAPAPHRLVAFMMDAFVIVLSTFTIAGALASALPGALAKPVGLVVLAIGTFVFFVRDSFHDGRGIGKKAMGLRCVDLASNRGCTRAQSLIRQGFLGLGLAGVVELVMLHVDESGRRMADRMMNTQVILEKDKPLSGGGQLMAGLAYLWLIASGVGAVVGLFTPAERTYRAASATVELPAGWEFGTKDPHSVNALRRSLLRGEELRLELEMKPALSGSATDEHAAVLEDGKMFRDLTHKVFQTALEGFTVKKGRDGSARTIAGHRAYEFDILFSGHGASGIVRGLCFRAGIRGYYVTVLARDEGTFRAREPELDRLLAALKVH